MADVLEVLKGEGGLGKLSVGDLLVNHIVDHLGDVIFGEVRERVAAGFDSVGHHEDSALACGGFGSGITEERGRDGLSGVAVNPGVIEIAGEGCAVVCEDELGDDLGEPVFLRHACAFGDVADDDLRRLFGFHLGEGVMSVLLVLSKILGVCHLADVMVERSCTYEERVGAYLLSGLCSEVADLH